MHDAPNIVISSRDFSGISEVNIHFIKPLLGMILLSQMSQ